MTRWASESALPVFFNSQIRILSLQLAAIVPLLPLDQSHPLIQLFQVKVLIELHSPQDTELAVCEQLLGPDFFPNSLWIMSMRACTLYHLHGMFLRWALSLCMCSYSTADFSNAEVQFDRILELDPYRIDDIDIFSNILYVAENRTKLSKLAHHFLAIDKDRPEVCCLVGMCDHSYLQTCHLTFEQAIIIR